ncbi:unnamed protein product [Gongylonema pulchrum]|uniref:Uncharacterized protein n=1 Tax=Gongylonema pulchrum TaxID=637853 RepID=A0A183EYS0_9BILA|nr:unnamed protein product [Gongylonema pulchrum]
MGCAVYAGDGATQWNERYPGDGHSRKRGFASDNSGSANLTQREMKLFEIICDNVDSDDSATEDDDVDDGCEDEDDIERDNGSDDRES